MNMLSISAKIRENLGKRVKTLRKNGILPAVLYGPEIKTLPLKLNLKEFEKVYQAAGESSLISLEVDTKKFLVLIYETETDAISQKLIHVDFYQPKLDEEITATIPLVFEGVSPAVKDLEGTLVRNIQELEVRALPQNLPHEIKIDIGGLKTFGDHILIKDLKLPEGVRILKEPGEIVASVSVPEKVEEELTKPIEEKVEEVERVKEKKPSPAETMEGKEAKEKTA